MRSILMAAFAVALVLGLVTTLTPTASAVGCTGFPCECFNTGPNIVGTAASAQVNCEGVLVGACTHVVGFYGPCAEQFQDGHLYLRIIG